ncbi:unnamed protein product [Candidula unifasciata]|uniref:Hexosyltransferase n=1 Tax=Candidula unifasciata TaxID=100452 RepID=A0A8S3ZG89_9EUPU|nr:unnamed protein product [Candidula unifasciata]
MFPRPSRLCRLIIFLCVTIFVATAMYVVSLDMLGKDYIVRFGPHMKFKSTGDISYTSGFLLHPYHDSKQPLSEIQKPLYSSFRKNGLLFHEIVMGTFDKNAILSTNADADMSKDANNINSHNFDYIHNPYQICEGNITFLIYIHSAPENLKKRQAVRQTWGHPKLLSLYNATVMFVLGRALDPSIQNLIDMEATQYGDILQENFMDSYRNLTYKGLAGLRWAGHFCAKTNFLLKTDDDILLDIISFMEHLYTRVLPARESHTQLVLCNVWSRMKVIRDSKSKWFVSRQEFPDDYFPTYCSGSAFLLSGDLIQTLYHTALQTPFFWIDDYYVTGMLVNKLKIQHTRLNSAYLMDPKELMIFHVKKLSLFLKLWPVLLQRHSGMEKYIEPVDVFSHFINRQSLLNISTSDGVRDVIQENSGLNSPSQVHKRTSFGVT